MQKIEIMKFQRSAPLFGPGESTEWDSRVPFAEPAKSFNGSAFSFASSGYFAGLPTSSN
jgi:hypothetical protein